MHRLRLKPNTIKQAKIDTVIYRYGVFLLPERTNYEEQVFQKSAVGIYGSSYDAHYAWRYWS